MEKQKKVISPHPVSTLAYFKRVWQYKSLIVTLAKRDIQGYFAQTLLGWLWMVIKPIITLGLFSVFFGEWLSLDTASVPYPLFAFSGMVIWYSFSTLVNSCGNALQQSSDLVRKMYFPKLILLLSKTAVGLVELGVHLILLFIFLMLYGIPLSLPILWILPALLLSQLFGFSIALWISALSLKRRDILQFAPHLVNFAIWLTPVFYPVTIVPEKYHFLLYFFNPIATSIEGFRYGLFGMGEISMIFLYNIVFVLLFLGLGLLFFIKKEKHMVDFL